MVTEGKTWQPSALSFTTPPPPPTRTPRRPPSMRIGQQGLWGGEKGCFMFVAATLYAAAVGR